MKHCLTKALRTYELVPTIRKALYRYDMDEMSRFNIRVGSVLAEQKSWLQWKPCITLTLVRVSSIVDPYTHDEDWHTELIAQRGVSLKQKINIKRRVSYTCEYGVEADITARAGLKIGKLVSEIETALEKKFTLTGKIQYQDEVTIEAEQEIEVKDLGDTPTQSGLMLQSREYQAAPVYIRVNCVLGLECSCCQIPRYFNASLDFPTTRIALRQVEHFDKGPEQKIYTGFVQANTTP